MQLRGNGEMPTRHPQPCRELLPPASLRRRNSISLPSDESPVLSSRLQADIHFTVK